MRRGFALLLLMGCGMFFDIPFPASAPRDWQEAGIRVAVEEWRQTPELAPYAEICAAQRERLRVAILTGADFRRACGACAAQEGLRCAEVRAQDPACAGTHCANECFTYADGIVGGVNPKRQTPIIVISEGRNFRGQRRLLIHSAMHWLIRCTGEPYSSNYHEDPRIWKNPTEPTRGVQGRALQTLGW